MTQRIAGFLVRFHWQFLIVAGILAICSAPLSWRLRSDWQVADMFASNDPLVESYQDLQRRFGGNEIVLAVYRDPDLWTEAGLERLDAVTHQLAEVDGVRAVLSLSELHNILQTIRGPLGLLDFSGTERKPPILDPDDKLAQRFVEVFDRYTHRKGSEYVAVACLLSPASSSISTSLPESPSQAVSNSANREPAQLPTIRRLRDVLAELPEPASDGLVAGEPVLVSDGFQLVQRDGTRLGIASSILVSLVLLVCFRSIRWTLIPLAVVHWALLMTQAVLVVANLELTMVSSTLTAIVTVIGVATSMHLLLKFQQNRRQRIGPMQSPSLSRAEALQSAFSVLLVPIAWACVTDAIGFLALMAADVGPVRDFGLMMAIGSLMVLAAIVLLVPGLALIGNFDTDPRTPKFDLVIRLWLRRLLDRCLQHRRAGLVALGLVAAFAFFGSLRMQVETDFTKNFNAESPLVRSYQVIERELGGAGVWDVMLPTPDVITDKYFEQVLELEEGLRQLSVASADGSTHRLTKVLSVADADAATEASSLLSRLPVRLRLTGMRNAMPDFSDSLLMPNADRIAPSTNTTETERLDSKNSAADPQAVRWLRVMLRSKEQSPAAAKSELIAQVQYFVNTFTGREAWRSLFDESPPKSVVTGYHVMLSRLVSSVLADQWICFLLASLGIFLVMFAATRSLWLASAALVPNALPILVVLGAMGWAGTPVNMGAAMIAAVSMGLSIDSSIHYLLHFRRHRERGERPLRALRSAQENVGLAVVLATTALIAGFISLCGSEFVPTVVFGTLASLTMLGGLFGNLIVLPMLIAPRDLQLSNER